MKLQSKGSPTTFAGNTGGPSTFGIKQNRASFTILSSGLYNDKIKAIVRELSCNAYDAHVAAGKKTQPFEIHLPTEFEPYFTIKDFGTGLNVAAPHLYKRLVDESTGEVTEIRIGRHEGGEIPKGCVVKNEDEVLVLYCTYFESNKNDSNEFVGALGLGSKSPFSYTDGFTVVNRYNGQKRTYTAFISEEGTPNILPNGCEDTDEGNGLEVSFPVKSQNIWEFENKAKVALEFFNPLPNLNVADFEPVKQEYVVKNEKWGVRKNAQTHETNGVRAIQGMVQYGVGTIDISRLNQEQQKIARLPLDIFMPIGSLSVAASREMLSNDEQTLANIVAVLGEISDSMVEEAKKKLNECKTAWQARLEILRILQTSGLGDIIRDAYNQGKFFGKYDNFNLQKEHPSLFALDYKHIQINSFTRSGKKRPTKNAILEKPKDDSTRQMALLDIQNNPALKKNYQKFFEADSDTVFIWNDLGQRCDKFVQAYVQGTDSNHNPYCKRAIVFSTAHGKGEIKKAKKEFDKAMGVLGSPAYLTMSFLKSNFAHLVDLLKPTKRERVTGILELTGDGTTYRSRYTDNAGWAKATWDRKPFSEIPAGVPKFYIPVEKNILTQDGWRFSNAPAFIGFLNNVKNSGLYDGINKNTRLFGLTKTAIPKLEEAQPGEWINFLNYVTDDIQTTVTPAKQLELSLQIKPFECNHEELLRTVVKRKDMEDSPLTAFAKSYLEAKAGRREERQLAAARVLDLLSSQGKFKLSTDLVNFKSIWRKLVLANYPLLGVDWSNSRYNRPVEGVNSEKAFVQYVKAMDVLKSLDAVEEKQEEEEN